MTDVLEGAHIAGCRIEAVAGRGGMGIVYRATQLSLARPVAVKLIAPEHALDAGFRERFERESRMAAAIEHPNVIPVYGAGEEDGRLYLVMRWVAGTDLHRLLRAEGRLDPLRAAEIVHQMGGALDAAHAAGLVHRDVKPANVLLSGEHAYLADFGLTRLAGTDPRMTTTGQFLGTVDYMAPEQFRHEGVDARADVYALACVLYAALTGQPPFPRETVPATMLAHMQDPAAAPSLSPGVPREFDRVLARALAKSPDDRYPSAGDLGRATLAAAEGRSVTEVERSVARGEAAPHTLRRPSLTLPLGDRDERPRRRRRREKARRAEATRGGGEAGAAGRGGAAVRDPLWGGAAGRGGAANGADPWAGAGPAPAAVKRYRSRRRRLWPWMCGAAAVAGVVAALAIVPQGGGPPPPGGSVSSGDAERLARSFARAYAQEDPARMSRLLTSDAQRVTPADRESGRTDVVGAYKSQFARNETTGFELSGIDSSGGAVARVTAKYRASYRGAPDTTGTITFDTILERGKPKIALIVARPD